MTPATTTTAIDAQVAQATKRLHQFINRTAAQQTRRMTEAWRKPAMTTTAAHPAASHTPLELERIRTEAQKAAWEFDHINDACPYPFASVAGVTFKEAFLTAQAIQRQLLTLSSKGQA